MQPDPHSRHPVGGFPADENAILCQPLTEFAPKKFSKLPPSEKIPSNRDSQGDHNEAEQSPQKSAATRRRRRTRREIAHAFVMLSTTRYRTKRSMRRRGGEGAQHLRDKCAKGSDREKTADDIGWSGANAWTAVPGVIDWAHQFS
jgi:hypothetical protein